MNWPSRLSHGVGPAGLIDRRGYPYYSRESWLHPVRAPG
jgi:hypothetical protein